MEPTKPADFKPYFPEENLSKPKEKEDIDEASASDEEFDIGDNGDDTVINEINEEQELFLATVHEKHVVRTANELKNESFKTYLLGQEAAATSAVLTRHRNARLEKYPETMTLDDKWLLEDVKVKDKHVEKTKTGEIYSQIDAREKEIQAKKEKWRSFVAEKERTTKDPSIKALYKHLKTEIKDIEQENRGQGGSYRTTHIYFKPNGEDICEVHNRKGNAAAFLNNRSRRVIPLYQGCERSAASFESACVSQIPHVTPPTVLAIATSEIFSHISDQLPENEKSKLLAQLKTPINREKLGSLQQRVEGGDSLLDIEEKWGIEGRAHFKSLHPDKKYTEDDHIEYLKNLVDVQNYEDCNFFLWKTGEADGNRTNFIVKQAKSKNQEPGKYFFIKIDNSLTYPEKNEEFDNKLANLELGQLPMSERLKKKIQGISAADEVKILKNYGLSAAIPATLQRISAMKVLVERFPEITIREMNFRLSLLEKENPKHVKQGRFKEILRDLTPSEIVSLQVIPSRRLEVAFDSEKDLQKLLKEENISIEETKFLESTTSVQEKIQNIRKKIALESVSNKNEPLMQRKVKIKNTPKKPKS